MSQQSLVCVLMDFDSIHELSRWADHKQLYSSNRYFITTPSLLLAATALHEPQFHAQPRNMPYGIQCFLLMWSKGNWAIKTQQVTAEITYKKQKWRNKILQAVASYNFYR